MWIWERDNWPEFSWNQNQIQPLLDQAHMIHQSFLKQISWLHTDFANEAEAQILVDETMHTSAIEGELLQLSHVRSSVARHLGIPEEITLVDKKVDALVELLLDSSNYQTPLSKDRLLAWHAGLFPSGYSSIHKIDIGCYRREEMYVMSGPYGKETVHFEAPPPIQLESLMANFITWFDNYSKQHQDGIIRSGVAHLYFVTIHPFDDGNGRISRALIDLALSQFEQSGKRFYRLSTEIERNRKNYYSILESTQKGTLDITNYITWFLETFIAAIQRSENTLQKILNKAKFWQQHYITELNLRQKKALNLLLDNGNDFIGNLNTRKYVSINKVSRVTAYRELSDMVEKECLIMVAQGRSTSYKLKNK